MKVEVVQVTDKLRALNAARFTAGKKPLDKGPSDKWWAQSLLSEHSPIRLVEFDVYITDCPRYVIDHIVRYNQGVEKFVRSQRPDRNKDVPRDRSELSQSEPTDCLLTLNVQTLLYIARQRLCNKASKETQQLVRLIREEIYKIDPILAIKMVPNCVYHGFCPEYQSCGFSKADVFKDLLYAYHNVPE